MRDTSVGTSAVRVQRSFCTAARKSAGRVESSSTCLAPKNTHAVTPTNSARLWPTVVATRWMSSTL